MDAMDALVFYIENILSQGRRFRDQDIEKFYQEPVRKIDLATSCERRTYIGCHLIEELKNSGEYQPNKLYPYPLPSKQEKRHLTTLLAPSIHWMDRASELMLREIDAVRDRSRIIKHGIEKELVTHASHQITFAKLKFLNEHICPKRTGSITHASQQSCPCDKEQQPSNNSTKEMKPVARALTPFEKHFQRLKRKYAGKPFPRASHQTTFTEVQQLSKRKYTEQTESIAHASHQTLTEVQRPSKRKHGKRGRKKTELVVLPPHPSCSFNNPQQLSERKYSRTKLKYSHYVANPFCPSIQPNYKHKESPEPEVETYALCKEPFNKILLKASEVYRDTCVSGSSFQTKNAVGFASCLVSEEMWRFESKPEQVSKDTNLSSNLQQHRGQRSLVSKDCPNPSSVKFSGALVKELTVETNDKASGTTTKTYHLMPFSLREWSYGTQACLFEFYKCEPTSKSGSDKSGKQEGSREEKKEDSEESDSNESAAKKRKQSGDPNR